MCWVTEESQNYKAPPLFLLPIFPSSISPSNASSQSSCLPLIRALQLYIANLRFCPKTIKLATLLIFNKSKDHCDTLSAQPVNTPLAANDTLRRSCLNFSQACRPQLIDESDTFSCGPCSLMWWYHYGPSQWEFLINANMQPCVNTGLVTQ